MAVVTALPRAPRGGPAAADVDPEHLVAGLAASLGDWRADQFTRFLAWFGGGHDGEPVPLFCDHERWRFTSHGRESADVGVCLDFAAVPPWPGFPGGLLVLAGLYPDRAPQILGGMSRGQWRAMSVRGVEHGIDLARGGDLWIGEVSLVSKVGDQVDPAALVLGTGGEAASVWELLTGSPAAVI